MNTEGLCEKELKRRLKQKITLQYITYSSFKMEWCSVERIPPPRPNSPLVSEY